MSKKLIFHLLILGALALYTVFAYVTVDEVKDKKEMAEEVGYDPFEDVNAALEKDGSTQRMLKVGLPLLVTMIYGGVVFVLFALPVVVDKLAQEMIGSSEELGPDPLTPARTAVEDEDYLGAIVLFREAWQENLGNRVPMAEIALIQRKHLDSPAVALSTLEEALEGFDWEEDDRAFFLFRMVDIYEEDLQDREMTTKALNRIAIECSGSRHAGNAMNRLRELS